MNVFPANGGEVLLDGSRLIIHKNRAWLSSRRKRIVPKKLVIDQLAYFAELKG